MSTHPSPPSQAQKIAWRFFQDVAIPAVLGNTLWAALYLVTVTPRGETTLPCLLTLIVLSVFFLGDWRSGADESAVGAATDGARLYFCYIPLTGVFFLAIAAVAIQVGTLKSPPFVPMLVLFGVTALGQWQDVWVRPNEQAADRIWRKRHTVSNGVAGLLILFGLGLSKQSEFQPEDPRLHWISFVAILTATGPLLWKWFGPLLSKSAPRTS